MIVKNKRVQGFGGSVCFKDDNDSEAQTVLERVSSNNLRLLLVKVTLETLSGINWKVMKHGINVFLLIYRLNSYKGDLDDIDEDALETAENNFANLNSTYWNDLDVDGIMERMRGLQEVQETEIKSHQLSLEEIKKQVQNVQDISDSLPEFCPFERSLEKVSSSS